MALLGSSKSAAAIVAVAATCVLLESPAAQASKDFLGQGTTLRVQSVLADLQRAMSAATGQGQIRRAFTPIFEVLPKNKHGRIEAPMLRYALHRYFLQQFSIQVRGLEPRQNGANASSLVAGQPTNAEIFQERVPASVEAVLEGRFAHNGFGLEDAVTMAAVFEQLVLEPRGAAFERAVAQGWATGISLTRQGLKKVLRDYVLSWIVGDEDSEEAERATPEEIKEAIENDDEAIPHWSIIIDFVHGEIDRIEDMHHHQGTRNPFTDDFSVDDLQSIARSVTATFGMWWEQECQSIKSKLLEMDPERSGRVRLSAFYRRALDGEWRFGESENYLRDLGVLDETSRWHGPQVMIPNYLLGPNNCIVSSTYYHVCCVNECEALLGQVESKVQGPVATPEQVLDVVMNMTEDGQHSEKLWGTLVRQLLKIAEKHRGKIPLHGRLFLQWMHYVFPQECPFPKHAGTIVSQTPSEFGDSYVATEQDMKAHAKKAKLGAKSSLSAEQQAEVYMSQWTEDEELLAEYMELRAPLGLTLFSEGRVSMLVGVLFLAGIAYMVQTGKLLGVSSNGLGATDSPAKAQVYCI